MANLTNKQIEVLNDWSKHDPALFKGHFVGDGVILVGDIIRDALISASLPSEHPLQGFLIDDHSAQADYFKDFGQYDGDGTTEYVVTEVGTSVFFGTGDIRGGGLSYSPGAVLNDYIYTQQSYNGGTAESSDWVLRTSGEKTVFLTRTRRDTAIPSLAVDGLITATDDPFGGSVTNGVYFRKTDGLLELVSTASSSSTAISINSDVQFDYSDYAFVWNGSDSIAGWLKVLGVWKEVGTITTDLPTDLDLSVSSGVQITQNTGTATHVVDYVQVVQQRNLVD